MARLAPVWKCQNTLYNSSRDACAVASYALCWYAEFADDTNTTLWVDCSSRLLNCNLLSALRLAIVQRADGCLVYLAGTTWHRQAGWQKYCKLLSSTLDTIILHSVGIFRFAHFWRVLDYSPGTTFHTQPLAIYRVFF